jgi:hypothetical protein
VNIMNAIETRFRNVTCAAAALAITAVLCVSFVQSTDELHWTQGSHAAGLAKVSTPPVHAWFGQPQPAVLVD